MHYHMARDMSASVLTASSSIWMRASHALRRVRRVDSIMLSIMLFVRNGGHRAGACVFCISSFICYTWNSRTCVFGGGMLTSQTHGRAQYFLSTQPPTCSWITSRRCLWAKICSRHGRVYYMMNEHACRSSLLRFSLPWTIDGHPHLALALTRSLIVICIMFCVFAPIHNDDASRRPQNFHTNSIRCVYTNPSICRFFINFHIETHVCKTRDWFTVGVRDAVHASASWERDWAAFVQAYDWLVLKRMRIRWTARGNDANIVAHKACTKPD